MCPSEKSFNNDPVRSEEPGLQIEVGSRDWLKVKSKLKGAEKIHVKDGREACDLDLSASMSSGDVPSALSLKPSPGTRTESKKTLNQNRQGVRKLFPTSLCSRYV